MVSPHVFNFANFEDVVNHNLDRIQDSLKYLQIIMEIEHRKLLFLGSSKNVLLGS